MSEITRTAVKTAFVFALLLFFSCAGLPERNEPQWVSDPYRVYNRTSHIAAVGYGPSRESAEKNALAALTAIFGQAVSSESKSSYEYSQALEKSKTHWSENSDIALAVKTSVEMDVLIGAEIKDVWNNGQGTFYAAAAMERAKTALIYSELVQQNLQVITRLTSSRDRQSFDAYARYQQAAVLADANAVFVNVMKVISPASAAGENLKNGNDYRIEAAEIARNIPIAVNVENDKQDRIRRAFSGALSTAGFRTGGSARYELRAKLALEEVQFAGNPYRWIRYTVEGSLADNSEGTVLFPYVISGREGHNSVTEAENKALGSAENSIQDSYVKVLENFLSRSAGRAEQK